MILIIDNYDSFTWNLVQSIQILGHSVCVLSNDKINSKKVLEINPKKIILSPGPGNPNDSGQTLNIIKNFWKIKPILGVCLGHQCIGSIFGSTIIESKRIIHGKTSLIYHNGSDLFSGIQSPFQAARYHSLCIKSVPENFDSIAWTEEEEIMGISHVHKPVFGIQFHPESFLTPRGNKIISNFLNLY